MDKHQYRKVIYTKVDQLPTLPTVLPKLLSQMEGQDVTAIQLEETISTDPALTSKILQVANSAYYGFSKTISNLKRALPLLGLDMVRSLALTMSVMRTMPKTDELNHFSQSGLWKHSLATAAAIHELGKRLELETEYLFTLGLLHDVGKVVLMHFFGELYAQALELAHGQEPMALCRAESQVVGLDHSEAGRILLNRWKFPVVITGPIGVHHLDDPPKDVDEIDVALLRVADTLALEAKVGSSGNPAPGAIPEGFLKTLKMKPKDLQEMREFMAEKDEGISEMFSAMG